MRFKLFSNIKFSLFFICNRSIFGTDCEITLAAEVSFLILNVLRKLASSYKVPVGINFNLLDGLLYRPFERPLNIPYWWIVTEDTYWALFGDIFAANIRNEAYLSIWLYSHIQLENVLRT